MILENQTTIENTKKIEPEFDEKVLLSVFSYLFGWISGVVVLNIPKYRKDAELRFHAWQSIILSCAYVLVRMVIEFLQIGTLGLGLSDAAVSSYPSHLSSIGFVLLSNVSWAINAIAFLLWLGLIVRVMNKEDFDVPFASRYARKFAMRGEKSKK